MIFFPPERLEMPGAAIPAIAEGEIPGFGHTKAAPNPLPCSFKQQPEASSASSSQKKRGRAKKKKGAFWHENNFSITSISSNDLERFSLENSSPGKGLEVAGGVDLSITQQCRLH